MLYIHDHDNWWQFRYDSLRIMNELGRVRSKQGMIIGRMLSLGFDSQDDAVPTTSWWSELFPDILAVDMFSALLVCNKIKVCLGF